MDKHKKFSKKEVLELLRPIKLARVVDVRPHPNADRLLLVDVNLGEDKPKQVVTGANNMKEGDIVPFLGEGNIIPGYLLMKGEELVLQKKNLRGIDSDSMILSEDEIGLSDGHSEIMLLNGQAEEKHLGSSILEILSDDQVDVISRNAGIIEVTPELRGKIEIIKSIAKYGGELVGEDELPAILTSGKELFTYDGFEPSGQMHIAQGIVRAINTNKMIQAGFSFKMWVADWFGYLNNKMGGDMEKIKTVGKYFIEIWRATGMDLDNVEFMWTSDFIGEREYWETVMQVARSSTLKRVLRTTEIMGRSETENLTAAQILYPCMQITDIFKVIKCQVTQLGLDQRKVNMLAREIGQELGFWKPVVLSHGMLQGLGKPLGTHRTYIVKLAEDKIADSLPLGENFSLQPLTINENEVRFSIKKQRKDSSDWSLVHEYSSKEDVSEAGFYSDQITSTIKNKEKINGVLAFEVEIIIPIEPEERAISMKMSKSKPDTAIFMTDFPEEVERKIRKAYCPEGITEDNPILDYCRQVIFEAHYLKGQEGLLKDGFVVERPEKYGGKVIYPSYEELEKDYLEKNLFPLDLKNAVVKYLNLLLKPVREHFENDKNAKSLLKEVKTFQVTR